MAVNLPRLGGGWLDRLEPNKQPQCRVIAQNQCSQVVSSAVRIRDMEPPSELIPPSV